MVGSLGTLKRCFRFGILVYPLVILVYPLYFRVFLGMITNYLSEPDHPIVVMQSNVDVNQINSNFKVFSKPQRLHWLRGSQSGPQ